MATANLNVYVGSRRVIDKRRDALSASSPISAATYAAGQSMATLDAALVVQNGTYWTQARLDSSSYDDKLHALRMASSDAAGV